MKKIISVCSLVLCVVGVFCCFSGCSIFDTSKKYTVNFQYNVGDGKYDYSIIYNEGDEITEPYDKDVTNDYYVIQTLNGNDVKFPLTVNSDCTLVGNTYKYDYATNSVFLGGLVDYDVLVEYLQTNWTRKTMGNVETDNEDFVYYYIKYVMTAEYNEIYFYPSTNIFKWSKTKMSNITLGKVINNYQYTSQITATYGETMDKASFKAVYACESIHTRNLVVKDSVNVSFKYQINKCTTGIILQDFRDVKYTYSMSNPYSKFDDKTFAKDLYGIMQDSMWYFQNQLTKINEHYFLFFSVDMI